MRKAAGSRISSPPSALPTCWTRGRLPERASPVGADLGPLTAKRRRAISAFTGAAAWRRADRRLCRRARRARRHCRGDGDLDRHLALIAGTSSCVMAMSPQRRPFRGGWGPYFGAALARLLDRRRRAVGDRRAARPPHSLAWRRRRADAGARTGDRRARSWRCAPIEGPDLAGAPARAAGLPWQPLAARRPACARRDQRADARRLLRQPLPALLAHLRRRSRSASAISSRR